MAFQKHNNLIVGRNAILEAIASSKRLEKIFYNKGMQWDELKQVLHYARTNAIPVSAVPVAKLNSLTKVQHQGIIAFGSLVDYVDLQDAINFVNDKGQTPTFVLLDGVTDVRNIGAIARSAWCLDVQVIILPISNTASINEEAIKTSAGALSKVILVRIPSVEQAIDILKLNGFTIYATDLKGSQPIDTMPWDIPLCIVLGSEGKGISKYVQRHADANIRIPMSTNFDSLNVSVSAGIIFYQALMAKNVKK